MLLRYWMSAFGHTRAKTDWLPTPGILLAALLRAVAAALALLRAVALMSCWRLGMGVRQVFKDFGYTSVAADEFAAPGVVVVFAKDAEYAARFKAKGLQIAAGVPFKLGEPEGTTTYRIGLFGRPFFAFRFRYRLCRLYVCRWWCRSVRGWRGRRGGRCVNGGHMFDGRLSFF